VRLWFEHGAALADADGLLEGDGRGRFIAVAAPDTPPAATLARYVHDAVAQRLFRR
jgi:hypothetical protein